MVHSFLSTTRFRKNMARGSSVIVPPPLVQLQKSSYESFLQMNTPLEKREDCGLQAVFSTLFPVQDTEGLASVEFVSYRLETPRYSEAECRRKGLTYATSVKVMIRFVLWNVGFKEQDRHIRGFKEQEVYFGELPLMTRTGAFIVNGAERVVVSQLHRSPGVFFDHDRGRTLGGTKILYSVRLIPSRGSWLDFEFDSKDLLYCRIDRRRKLPGTIFLKALGYSTEQLLDLFYDFSQVRLHASGSFEQDMNFELYKGKVALWDVVHPKTQKVLVARGEKITSSLLRKIQAAGVKGVLLESQDLVGAVLAEDLVDLSTGEVFLCANQELTAEILDWMKTLPIQEFSILVITEGTHDRSFRESLLVDGVAGQEEALLELYRRIRPGDPVSIEGARQLFSNMFFSSERYDLSQVGRLKINEKLGRNEPQDQTVLTAEDILVAVQRLYRVRGGEVPPDDIDHLGNRRVRVVGELVENQYRVGLSRVERAIRDRLQLQEVSNLMPHDLVNAKPISAIVKEFFGTSQLSQFMDQTNPLAEIYHKRRLSALGPGGLSRDRAGFEVRDVHATHYGRICPIETPEGPNIGLIVSLGSFARINEYGFIETPYQKIEAGRRTREIQYFNANDEWSSGEVIGQASLCLSDQDRIEGEALVNARQRGETHLFRASQVSFMDVSSFQPVSIAAALIPFLQNDDAHRALMGANMQRQGVPLLSTQAPLVGTGMEAKVAQDSGSCVLANRAGVVVRVDSERIVIRVEEEFQSPEDSLYDLYRLEKFRRSNVDTCINQRPLVEEGQFVAAGQVLADGFASHYGELALGQNVMVAFMPWEGYNYEDAIIVSERVIKEDLFTSVHIQEFECVCRDTKLGKEEVTSDLPNASEEAVKDLDDCGIIRIGANVAPGDILVGKLTPKVESQLTPEERLLRAVFGEKAADVKDTSLRVPPGVQGTVVAASVFSREGVGYDSRQVANLEDSLSRFRREEAESIEFLTKSAQDIVSGILAKETLKKPFVLKNSNQEEDFVESGEKLQEVIRSLDVASLLKLEVSNSKANLAVARLVKDMQQRIAAVRQKTQEQIDRAKEIDELPPGVIKMVRVSVAVLRRLKVGDKLAGRHGNKGVISKIVPEDDMPFAEDGTPIDLILSPLGVPSRMNIGQVMEVHLGLAARALGLKLNRLLKDEGRPKAQALAQEIWSTEEEKKALSQLSDEDFAAFVTRYEKGVTFANPVFDGATEEDICRFLKLADLPETGQIKLVDGRSGLPFERPVTVGSMYIMKLHHLVDEKIHARSTGPYSLVTQQPLGGKAQFGGQRLGEMEVWALEAYGASYSLQEFLTVKSDDIRGRVDMYESIVRGEYHMRPETPESFNVLVKEMQALGLDMKLLNKEDEPSS